MLKMEQEFDEHDKPDTKCEAWAVELGFSKSVVESRDNKTEFYEQLGYEICGEALQGDTFRCIRMEKDL